MCNLLFDFELINMNKFRQNVEKIDLVDSKNKVIVQVSATCSKQKIEDSLSKNILSSFPELEKIISELNEKHRMKGEYEFR